MLGAMDLGIADDSERAGHEQAAQIAIALLADTAEPVLAPARVLFRHEPDPGRAPHQFRHLAAKIILDANPGAFELVQQLLGHRNTTTTINYYGGIDTRRAGRAHADLVRKLKESGMRRRRRRRT